MSLKHCAAELKTASEKIFTCFYASLNILVGKDIP